MSGSESALRESEDGFLFSGLEILSSHSGVMMVNLSKTLIFLSHNFKNSKEIGSVLICNREENMHIISRSVESLQSLMCLEPN